MMNIAGTNVIFELIVGDMRKLPSYGQWQCIKVGQYEELLWNSADLKCCFYVYEVPVLWRVYMVFDISIQGCDYGIEATGTLYLCSKVVPMGWTSATSII